MASPGGRRGRRREIIDGAEPFRRREHVEALRDWEARIDEVAIDGARKPLFERRRELGQIASDPALAVDAALDSLDVEDDAHRVGTVSLRGAR